ncbi:MAG: hypothetical protein ACXABY_15680, partial [Candidatus Thorarchaeota archaeon]
DLQGHVSVQLGIGGTVDLAHASFTDLLKNLVVTDRCSEHETPPHAAMQLEFMLRGEGGKGNGNGATGEQCQWPKVAHRSSNR